MNKSAQGLLKFADLQYACMLHLLHEKSRLEVYSSKAFNGMPEITRYTGSSTLDVDLFFRRVLFEFQCKSEHYSIRTAQ